MIHIEKTSPDGLTVETWRFCVIDTQIILDDYAKVVRPTRRHKGTATSHYNRLSPRRPSASTRRPSGSVVGKSTSVVDSRAAHLVEGV